MYFYTKKLKKTLELLKNLIHQNKNFISSYMIKKCEYCAYDLLKEEATKENGWERFGIEERWGGKDKHCWFRTAITIPDNFQGEKIIYQICTGREGKWDAANPQFLVYVNGKATQGFDVNHTELLLSDNAKAGDVYELSLFAYSGIEEGLADFKTYIAVLRDDIERLYYNIKVPLEVAELLGDEDKRRFDIINYLINTSDIVDFRKIDSKEFSESISKANEYIEKEFYSEYCGETEALELCIGHTHIDVAWQWTLAQTREKVARSFSTVLNLMNQYPEYKFMSSQPQLYKYLKEDHPEIYDRVKAKVKEGKWEIEGAMWLEADCNLTSGESLVRQIIHGKRFFKEEFDVDSKILWLPDVFGYSAALPQILQKSGIKYFMTTKISWNEYNRMPYDTFNWRGIDGTEVFTHFITTTDYVKDGEPNKQTTYNGNTNSGSVMGCWQRYQQKGINNMVLNCFGHGDGGGGATKEMLENLKRLEKGIPGAPKTKMAFSGEFFEELEKNVKGKKRLPTWVGELYLELHRGTYTTMARNKKFNRKTEFLNTDAEMFSVMNCIFTKAKYPKEDLQQCWETTLLNQFHDIIPGSSIKGVYDDSKKDYERINGVAFKILNTALDSITSKIDLDKTSVVVFNSTGFDRSDVAEFELPKGWENAKVYDEEKIINSQRVDNNKVIFYAEDILAKGYKTFIIEKAQMEYEVKSSLKAEGKKINASRFDITFDENYNISSIYDKVANREVLKENEKANVIQAFEDNPHSWDAWDINIYYQDKMWEINDIQNVELVEDGPVRVTLKVTRKFLDSVIVQYIKVYNDFDRIDFDTDIDWKEEHILLKAAFPVNVNAVKATYEIQYGNVERATHWNTSWDYGKFEVCAHKWADLSEGDYGVGLLNDCKYGHDIKDSVMRLTLLKSPTMPNPDADKERHRFVYSIYPHSGDWKEAKVAQEAYKLNCPLYTKVECAHTGILPDKMSFARIDKENIMIEVVKEAEEKDSNDIIIRMYEYHNKRSKVQCQLFNNIKEVYECNLLENNLNYMEINGNNFEFEIKPFEIKTFRIKL